MASTLPILPRLLFTVVEPISLLVGAGATTFDTTNFVTSQLPHTSQNAASYVLTPSSRMLAYQLGNMFGLVGLVGTCVLYTTNEPKVVRNFLIACAVGDIGHLAAVFSVMGFQDFVDVSSWNALAWGSIGFTTFLLVCRAAYLAGLFGEDEFAQVETQDARSFKEKTK